MSQDSVNRSKNKGRLCSMPAIMVLAMLSVLFTPSKGMAVDHAPLGPEASVGPEASLPEIEAFDPTATSCKLGWLPSAVVEPLNPYGISESMMVTVLGAATVGVGTLMWAGIDLGTAGMASAVAVGLWLAHLPLEIAIFGTGGVAAWEAYKAFFPEENSDTEQVATVEDPMPGT